MTGISELEPLSQSVRKHCGEMIRHGSRSFSLASRLFAPANRDAAFLVYGWCRSCDDEIDRHADESEEALAGRVARLRERTLSAMREAPSSPVDRAGEADPAFEGFAWVTRAYRIPETYPLELLEGLAMDARREHYDSLARLELYCYRVASTVGLMMTHVMGVTDERALKNARDLGVAMQLTNIARDVIEDAGLGRVYLPRNLMLQEGLTAKQHGAERLAAPENRAALARVVARLLDRADELYHSGWQGVRALPLSAAFAVGAAAEIYREIGVLVRARGERAWDQRAVASRSRKIRALVRAVARVAATLPSRWLNPARPVPPTRIWRPEQS
jgi:phytoene synthase